MFSIVDEPQARITSDAGWEMSPAPSSGNCDALLASRSARFAPHLRYLQRGGLLKEKVMAIKRRKKKAKRAAASRAYRQAMRAEGAPASFDILGLGDAFGTVFGGKKRKATAKRRATKKTRAGVKTARSRTTSLAKTPRRRKTTRRVRRA